MCNLINTHTHTHTHTQGEKGGEGQRGLEYRVQWNDPLVTQPEGEIELSQTNQSVQRVCLRVVPRVQSKLSRALHEHRGKEP